MTGYPLVPLTPNFIETIKQTYGLQSDEEACQIDIVRQFFNTVLTMPDAPKVEKKDLVIEQNGIKVEISILRPLGSGDKELPVVLFMHGGGWSLGNYETHRGLTNCLVDRLSCCVVFVHYSLSPEVKYPVALHECYAALCWIKENSKSIHVDYKSLAVLGDSSGGNLAAALTLYAKAQGNFDITYQILLYPAVHDNFKNESYVKNKDDAFLSPSLMQYYWDSYTAGDRNENTIVPLISTVEELKNLPPAFIISADKDILSHETEVYASKLSEANVPTVAVRYLGSSHGFITVNMSSPESSLAISQIIEVLKKHWSSI